jgi:hypothetical protein
MSGNDRSRPDNIRALLEEADRVLKECERVTNRLDRSMKQPFWPDRRRTPRFPSDDYPDGDDDAA